MNANNDSNNKLEMTVNGAFFTPSILAQQGIRIRENLFQFPEKNFRLFSAEEKERLLKVHIKEQNLIGC